MPEFRYKATNENTGKIVKGVVSATNERELINMLSSQGLEIISCAVQQESPLLSWITSQKLSQKELIAVFVHLEQLDRAGIPILESLGDLRDSTSSAKVKALMQEMHEAVQGGSQLSEAMAKKPKIFSHIFVGLVGTGEQTGKLYEAFGNIIHHLKWSAEIKRKTIKATRYPAFSILIMFGVIGFMMKVVVPQVTGFLLDQDIELPGSTLALISFSDFVSNNIGLLAASPLIAFILIKLLAINNTFRLWLDAFKLKIPFMGPILVKIDAARFCHFFAITFSSGIGVVECMGIAQDVVSNRAIKLAIDNSKDVLFSGGTLAQSVESAGFFPSLVIRMFKIGEESGNMESALGNVQYFYDQEINDGIEKVIGMIQPTLTFVVGGMIAWMAAGVFGPLYGSFSQF